MRINAPAGYMETVRELQRKAWEWRRRHPGKVAHITYHFPSDVVVAAVFWEAIDNHFVTANAEGMELLSFIGALEKGVNAPTVLMVQVALDLQEL